MKEEIYKDIIGLLRDIAFDAIDLKNNFQLSDGDIRSILYKEAMIEQYITDGYVFGVDNDEDH